MSKVNVVAKFTIKEEVFDYVYKELEILYIATHKYDEGCIQYDLHRDLEDKFTFTFVETWESMECLVEHEKKEHFINFIKNVADKIENLSIDKIEKLEIKG
jgi:quinol monooxygenase YgiN